MKKNILWIIIAVILVAVIAVAGTLYKNLSESYQSAPPESTEKAPTPAPDFTVIDMDGNEVKLSDFVGKPVVLNFWATWCYYCKEEMPDFNTAYEKYPDVHFMMVNATDGERETVEIAKEYLKESGYNFDAYFDTNFDAVNKFYVTGFPATIFIDKEGNIAARANGMIDYQTLENGIMMIQ